MSEERLEQVREIDEEQAYEKMRRAVEKASQEKARQVERARPPRVAGAQQRRDVSKPTGPASDSRGSGVAHSGNEQCGPRSASRIP